MVSHKLRSYVVAKLDHVQMGAVKLRIRLTACIRRLVSGEIRIMESVKIPNETQHIYTDMVPYVYI